MHLTIKKKKKIKKKKEKGKKKTRNVLQPKDQLSAKHGFFIKQAS
jgi:hypothetical protein